MRFIVFAVAALVALSVFAVRFLQQPIEAAPVEFTVQLTGDQETPPINTGGSAVAKFTWDDDTNLLKYDITVSGLPAAQITAAHFHRGCFGSTGGIDFDLQMKGTTTYKGETTLSAEHETYLKNQQWFLNIHSDTPNFPQALSGFARGQMIVPGSPPSPICTSAPPAENITSPRTGEGGLADSDTGWTAAAVVSALVLVPGVWVLARKRS
jgi:hypothetical protein